MESSLKRASSPEPTDSSVDKRLKQDDTASSSSSAPTRTELGEGDNISIIQSEKPLLETEIKPERWQVSCRTIKDRLSKLYKSNIMADCTFIVGDKDVKVYKVHSLILSMASPIFEDLIMDNPTKEIKVNDVEADVFEQILEYVYLDTLSLDSVEKTQSLYRAAQKFKLTLIIERAVQLMMSNMNFENIWPTFESAQITCDVILRAECLKYLKKHTRELLRHPKFLTVDKSVIEDLVNEDVLESIHEAELVNGVVQWAKAQCVNNDLPNTFETKRQLLGERIINKLRFLAFPQISFVKEVACTTLRSEDAILSREESYAVLLNLIVPGIEPLPDILSKETRARVAGKLRVTRKVFNPMGQYPQYAGSFGGGQQYDKMVVLANPSPISSFGAKNFCCDIVVNHPVTLVGIQVPTFFSPQKSTSMEYDETYVVTVQSSYNNRNIITTTSKAKVKYNSSAEILLNDTVFLERNIKYSILIYTSNMYYVSRKLTNLENRPPVQFSFKDTVSYFGAPSSAKLGTDFGFVLELIYCL